MKAKLVLTSKDRQTAQEVPFDRPAITIGRKPNNDLAFNRPEISGNHAAFLFENNEYYVTDLGSTNGTLLNGAQLVAREKYGLQDKDVITIAPYTIQFVVEVESMETMIEIPSEAIPAAAKKVGSGTKPDLAAAKKISTGTEEQMREEYLKQQQAEAVPPPPEAPAAPPPPPAAAKAEAPPPAAAAAQAKPAAVAAPIVLPEAGKTPSAMTDYLWLGIGAILVLAAIGLIVFIFTSF
jgi:pSer/pThr/pTyr-binding forkhead associated (FHA) protein